ncbi:MAG TPA: DUF2304 family protein [Solirubrobacteraceae bacterium]|nr:DUF2304 family protein [Solirubrobacteraceae bacterium]
MRLGAQIASICFAVFVFGVVFEMVRRRHLRERYAILWLAAALVLLLLAAWTQLLRVLASAVGIATPSNAFFVVAFAFLLLLVLHFSTVVSRLSDENRVLAQRLSLLEERARPVDDAQERGDAAQPDVGEPIRDRPARRIRAGSRP